MEQATGLGMLTALTLLPLLSQWVDSRWRLALQPALCLVTAALVPMVARRTTAATPEEGPAGTPTPADERLSRQGSGVA